jgi:[1-hydroxy-2-(trimethylamino)ethyl]phosphonate dioxygenase
LSDVTIIDEIFELFAHRGTAAYHGECVSQTEHALQTAELAERDGAPNELVIAALLHDLGHLLDGHDETLAENSINGLHEAIAHRWLNKYFSDEVTEPIRLHVEAKRYLCAVEPGYRASLSPASRRSLELQGGPMKDSDCAHFEANPFHHQAVRLRTYDDTAKVPELKVPRLEHYRSRLEAALRTRDPV